MTAPTYSLFTANGLGPDLDISQGGLVVTTSLDGTTADRKALALLPKGSGVSYFECQFFTKTQPSVLPTGVAVGVASPYSDLALGAGSDADSWAYDPVTGYVYNSGAQQDAFTFQPDAPQALATAERQVIGIYLDIGPSLVTMGIAIDGSYAGQLSLPTGQFWVPCVTVCGGAAGDTSAFFIFGQNAFNYPRIQAP